MEKHEFTKYEIATYLRDYNRTLTYTIMNQDVPLYEVFKHHMQVDNRIQYSIKDYYYEMISIYEILLLSKFLTTLYDNYFDNLLESSINKISIPDSIFINSNDRSNFSNRQIIKLIRNALNHNDNPSHDLVRFIRTENEKTKIEILLKNTKPIPFYVMLDINELMSICFEIKNTNSIIIISNRSTKPISLNSSNVNETLNNIFLRKFFARKKLTDVQKEIIISHINSNNKTKNYEKLFLENGMEYKDIYYSIAQKIKIEEDLKYWESIGEKGNDVISHLLDKVMPFSWAKDRVLTMNLILSNYYMRNGKNSIFDLIKDARQIYQRKNLNDEYPLNLYTKSFGIDENILYDSIDFENLLSITNIRVVQSTVEGDIFIIDVLYEARNNKIHLLKDDTRDKSSAQEDRTIKYKTYEKTGVWNYANSQYWVAYNGELPNDPKAEYLINSNDLFIIATIS